MTQLRCAVTGGAGYIGSVTSNLLLKAGHSVRILDDLSTGHRDAVPNEANLVNVDVLDEERLTEALADVDVVLHFAGRSIVSESVKDPDLYHRVNTGGTQTLLRAMRRANVSRLVFSSTAAVYGSADVSPIVESTAKSPTNPYGESKLAAEQAIAAATGDHLGAICLRYFNVAGAQGRFRERHFPETHVLPRLLDRARVAEGAPFEVYGTDWHTADGTCIRDYIHVVDLAQAHCLAVLKTTVGSFEAMNLGSETGYSVLETLGAVENVTGQRIPWVSAPRRAGDPERLIASSRAAHERLGWKAERSLIDMVRDSWDSLLAQEQG